MSTLLRSTTDQTKKTAEAEQVFSMENLKSDLKGWSVRGGAVRVVAQGAQFILRMAF
jgi:hypothetical protein